MRAASFALCIFVTAASADADRNQLAELGRSLLKEKCASCHAIDLSDESPFRPAPPMRDVYERFAPEELKAELSEGIVSRHPGMPPVPFSGEQVDALLVYLHQLAQKKPSAISPRPAP